MDHIGFENLNNSDLHSPNDTFDSLLGNINQDLTFDQFNEIIDEVPIKAGKNFYSLYDEYHLIENEEKDKRKTIYKMIDCFILALKLFDIVIRFIITVFFYS